MERESALYTPTGERKYLNSAEREAFEAALATAEPEVQTFGLVLLYTGFRMSEALQLTAGNIDRSDQVIRTESLKKRKKGVYRAVPVPKSLLDLLFAVHHLAEQGKDERLWGWSRATAYWRVRAVMGVAGINGEKACARGLRHSFGIACIEANIPPHMLQKWLGHARLETTAIYATAVGAEERKLAARLWKDE